MYGNIGNRQDCWPQTSMLQKRISLTNWQIKISLPFCSFSTAMQGFFVLPDLPWCQTRIGDQFSMGHKMTGLDCWLLLMTTSKYQTVFDECRQNKHHDHWCIRGRWDMWYWTECLNICPHESQLATLTCFKHFTFLFLAFDFTRHLACKVARNMVVVDLIARFVLLGSPPELLQASTPGSMTC